MASYDDIPIQVHVEDVPFKRSMSTKQWAPSPSSLHTSHSSPLHTSHHPPRHHRKSKRHESGHRQLTSSGRLESSFRDQYGGRPEIMRVGGVTGMLPNQQFSSRGQSPELTTSMSQGSMSQSSMSTYRQGKERGGHMKLKPTISAPAKAEILQAQHPLPSDDVLNALFDRLVERLRLSPEKVAELNMRTPEQKWSLILAQHELRTGIACVFYIEQLVRHAQPQLKEKHPRKKLLQNLQPLARILRDLEVDLRTNPNDSWVQEFVSTPNHGHVALIDLVKDLADNPYSVPRKNPRKYTVLEREPTYLYTALLCLKALSSHRQGFNAVLTYDPSLCVLAYCLNSESTRTKVLILKMMVTVLLAPGGHKKVLQAFDYFRAIMKEKTRFQLLIASLTNEPVEPAFQAAALCFINTVVQTARAPNSKVFHQHEFLEAGFSSEEVEKSLHGRQDERVLHELKEWTSNFISVQQFMDDLAVTKGRVRSLQEEVEQTHKHLHEADLDREALYEQTKNMIDKYERQREKNSRLNQSINDLLEVKLERDDLLSENKQLSEANKRYHEHTSELQEKVEKLLAENEHLHTDNSQVSELQQQVESLHKFKLQVELGTQTSESLVELVSVGAGGTEEADAPPPMATNIPAPPPLPPIIDPDGTLIPPPPPIPFGAPPVPPPLLFRGGIPGIPIKKPVIPNVPLPMLNWVPVRNPGQTVFKELNDEAIIETVDFTEFEALFQVKRFKKNEKSSKREKSLKKLAEQLCLIESRRARNLVIAKRRIGHSAVEIRDYILQTDLDGLPSEYCELLLKFIPTEEELADLAKHAHQYNDFAEADQFMYQLAKIERYEARLNCMAYMGNFDDLLSSTQPLIDAVLSASLSIFRSRRLKKVFEIILAFGNYMNSSRRGAVYGFKIESLSKITDTKSMDRKQTLLHYIVHVVEMVYPNVLSFYDDLNVDEACQVSMQLLAEDVQMLKKGLEDIKEEKEKEANNFITFSFYNQAVRKVTHVMETFSKMEDAYREVCLMFDESPKQTDPSEFFGLFAKFIKDWKKATQDNRTSKRRRMGTTADLLKKEEEEEPKNALAILASEAAAEAAARSNHIREETQKLEEETAEFHVDDAPLTRGGVEQDREAEAHDIREKGIHHLNLQARLPWLHSPPPAEDTIEDELRSQSTERVLSPDSGVVDQLSPDNISPAHAPTLESVQEEHSVTATGSVHSLLQNGDVDSFLDQVFIPPKDYPVEANLPPKDYPKASNNEPQKQVLADDDYYSMMTNGY